MEKTFRELILNNFDDFNLTDIATQGCEGGFNGLIYDSELIDLYDRYHYEMWAMMNANHDENPTDNGPLSVLNINKCVDDTSFKRQIVWYCAEFIASEYVQIKKRSLTC